MVKHALSTCSIFLAGSLLLAGCGAAPTPPPISSAGLAGNWLVLGSLPVYPIAATYLNQAVTLDVTGNQVSGTGSLGVSCANAESDGPVSFGSTAIASDGTFTLKTASTLPPNIQIRGTAPVNGVDTWSGTYTVTSGPCGVQTGAFSATPIQPLTGVYKASATLSTSPPPGSTTPTLTPVTMQVTFQQGGTNSTTGITSNEMLTGSIIVQGSPCFTSGIIRPVTAKTAFPADVEATSVFAPFTMNDGSVFSLEGFIVDASASKLIAETAYINGGACGSQTASLVAFTKQ